jgi:hypothetical protein
LDDQLATDKEYPMTQQTYRPILWLILITLVLGVAVILVGLPAPAQAGASLPPRKPTSTPGPDKKDKSSHSPVGAYIELQAPAGSWAVVQWQDSAGNWHEVEGWRGALPASARWWVAAKDFGKGPFRWAVSQGPGGSVLGLSSPFYLPGAANETLGVTAAPLQ